MNVLIIGGSGMLGHKLVQAFSARFKVRYTLRGAFDAVERFGIFHREDAIEYVDVTKTASVRKAIEVSKPDVVVNAVGVVKQIKGANDVESTLMINSIFPHRLAQFSSEAGARLVTISTDCVFAGTRGMYVETDVPDALDLYGQSKHWGEVSYRDCLTIRTSIIGRELGSRHGLVEWFLSSRGARVKGYSKAIFSGFPTIVFADILIEIIERHRDLYGVFHVSSYPISKFDVLKKIAGQFGIDVGIDEDPSFVIDRSLDSSKFRTSTGYTPLAWDEMIGQMSSDTTKYE